MKITHPLIVYSFDFYANITLFSDVLGFLLSFSADDLRPAREQFTGKQKSIYNEALVL